VEDLPHRLAEREGQPEGENQPVERLAPVQGPQGHDLGDRADDADDERGGDERDPEGVRETDHDEPRVGAQHVELAVGEVHDTEQPEDDRQAQREQSQRGPEDEAVQQLGQQYGHDVVHHASPQSVVARG
jgi:hypothetical protein